jgi:hypothetical protein
MRIATYPEQCTRHHRHRAYGAYGVYDSVRSSSLPSLISTATASTCGSPHFPGANLERGARSSAVAELQEKGQSKSDRMKPETA